MVLAGWLLGRVAAAAPDDPSPRVVVQSEGCAALDSGEVGRLLDLELSMVTTELRSGPPLQVALRCEQERMTIEVVDPLTRKRLARDIPMPAPEPGRERVVALAISQLFAASWLELLTATEPPPPPPDDPAPPPDAEAVLAARRVAERSTDVAPVSTPPRRELELLVGIGPRGRALESEGPLAGGRIEAVLRGWLGPSIGVVGLVGADYAQTSRRQGQVRGLALTAGGGLGWGYRPGAVGVGGHVVLSGGWARVRGIPREPGVPSGQNSGITGEASVGLGPRVRYGRLRFDVDAEAGLMLRPPIGLVVGEPAEAPMTMGGVWAGLVLRVGGSLLP